MASVAAPLAPSLSKGENSGWTLTLCRGQFLRQAQSNYELIELVKYRAESYLGGGIRDGRVIHAMRALDRAAFLPAESKAAAYLDEPVGIGLGQTCSQPSIVAFMLDKLEIEPGASILEVGAGCGYAAAIAALLCSPGGLVVAAEILPELAHAARANCAVALATIGLSGWGSAPVSPVEIFSGDGSLGLPGYPPFDRIFLSAGVARRSFSEDSLVTRLSSDGILLYPEALGRIYRLRRRGGSVLRDSWGGVAFVRLRGKNA
jgi:protein-L-isoaspartate(D-aspartate) O-methyltransferase